jgi:hypothetical protein
MIWVVIPDPDPDFLAITDPGSRCQKELQTDCAIIFQQLDLLF